MRSTTRIVAVVLIGLATTGFELLAQEADSAVRRSPSADTLALTLVEAQERALLGLSLLADRREIAIAEAKVKQARIYRFNPELEFEAPGAASGSLREYEASLTQQIEYGGQWGLRGDAAEAGLEQARRGVDDATREALTEVSVAYYASIAADRRLEVTEEVLTLIDSLLAATRIELQEGEISVLEANLAEIERGRARARVLAARRELGSAELSLKNAIGIPSDQPIRLANEVPDPGPADRLDPDSLVAVALVHRPDLAAQAAAVRQAKLLGRLATREALPELRVGLVAERETKPGAAVLSDGLEGESRFGLSVGLSLPFWNRNQGLRAETLAEEHATALRQVALELAIRNEVADAYQSYRAAQDEVETFEREVLPPARQNQNLLETAYQAGKLDLASLILLRNQLLEAEIGYWDAWLAMHEAKVALEAATGTIQATERSNR